MRALGEPFQRRGRWYLAVDVRDHGDGRLFKVIGHGRLDLSQRELEVAVDLHLEGTQESADGSLAFVVRGHAHHHHQLILRVRLSGASVVVPDKAVR